jgi:hypothetical protein
LANAHCGEHQQVLSRVNGDCEEPCEPPKVGHTVHKKSASKHEVVDTSSESSKKEQDVYTDIIGPLDENIIIYLQ